MVCSNFLPLKYALLNKNLAHRKVEKLVLKAKFGG